MIGETKTNNKDEHVRATEPHKEEPKLTLQEELSEMVKVAFIAILIALVIRSFLYEPFNIPSGSMKPTLLVGDYLFVSKSSYGYSQHSFPFGIAQFEGRMNGKLPKRGDVIVFKLPTNPSIDYIKRLVAMPGETVQVINGRLFINNKEVPREEVGYKRIDSGYGTKVQVMEYIETLPGGIVHPIYEEDDLHPLDNTPAFVVPEGHYFMMGDNRDNSRDSRDTDLVGFVPYENLVGRAEMFFFSVDGPAFEFWKWPWTVRFDRIFDTIKTPSTDEQ